MNNTKTQQLIKISGQMLQNHVVCCLLLHCLLLKWNHPIIMT